MRNLINYRRKILGVWVPMLSWRRLIHGLSGGRLYPHSLEGGWCPLCGAVFDYENEAWDFDEFRDGLKKGEKEVSEQNEQIENQGDLLGGQGAAQQAELEEFKKKMEADAAQFSAAAQTSYDRHADRAKRVEESIRKIDRLATELIAKLTSAQTTSKISSEDLQAAQAVKNEAAGLLEELNEALENQEK